MANQKPRRSLVFARLLRAVVLRQSNGFRLEDLLDVGDKRTLMSLLRLSGLTPDGAADFPENVDEFIKKQTLVTDKNALNELRRMLAARSIR